MIKENTDKTNQLASLNSVKSKLKAGKPTCGAFLQTNSNIAAEILSRAGFDWLMIDMEHSPTDPNSLLQQIQAMEAGGNTVPFVRAPGNDPYMIKRILDTGVKGLLVPYINTKEEAEKAVSYCLFPPLGIRGAALSPRAASFGTVDSDYITHTNTNMTVMVSIESREAVENLDQILSVENLDGVFIGPMDLAVSLGETDPNATIVQDYIKRIESKVLRSEKFLGTITTDWDKAKEKYIRGYQWLILMQDGLSLVANGLNTVSKFRTSFDMD